MRPVWTTSPIEATSPGPMILRLLGHALERAGRRLVGADPERVLAAQLQQVAGLAQDADDLFSFHRRPRGCRRRDAAGRFSRR